MGGLGQRRLRFVCKTFAEYVTPLHFETLEFWLEGGSLQRVTECSKDELISPSVKYLSFSFERYREDLVFSLWRLFGELISDIDGSQPYEVPCEFELVKVA